MDNKVSNDHLIYSHTGVSNEHQIIDVVQDALDKANIKSIFYVNVVSNGGMLCKYSYIWVTNKEAFDYLVSFKNQGYTTIKKLVTIDNPEFKVKPEPESKPEVENVMSYNDLDAHLDWSDSPATFNTTGDTSNKINVFEDVKITLMKIHYTPDQIGSNSSNDSINITFDQASFIDMRKTDEDSGSDDSESESDNRVHNVWIATNVPEFINLKIILKYLRPFVTDNAKGPLNFNGTKNMVPYPHINIKKNKNNNNKTIFVKFNPDSNDGQFALYMCRQLKVENGANKATLYFKHLTRKYD